jgi:hypothetical protein
MGTRMFDELGHENTYMQWTIETQI